MAQLTEVHRAVEKEVGSGAYKRLRSPVLTLDVALVVAYPLVMCAAAYLLWTSGSFRGPVYWFAGPLSGWALLSCSLVYHGVCWHRYAFGKWGS